MSRTVFPPVFGPDTSSVRSAGIHDEIERDDVSTLGEQQRVTTVTNVESFARGNERGGRAGELQRVARARVQRVELHERIERRDDLLTARTQLIGQLEQNALDLLEFLRLQLTHAIAEFDSRGRFDEQRCARRRGIVDDSARNDASLSAHGNHVSTVPHRHRHVGDPMVRLETTHLAFENAESSSSCEDRARDECGAAPPRRRP